MPHTLLTRRNLPLIRQIELALQGTGYPALRRIEVIAVEHVVILRGRVSTYHMKQMAQAVALGVMGAGELHNELDVI